VCCLIVVSLPLCKNPLQFEINNNNNKDKNNDDEVVLTLKPILVHDPDIVKLKQF
jgi:hypothetical protein